MRINLHYISFYILQNLSNNTIIIKQKLRRSHARLNKKQNSTPNHYFNFQQTYCREPVHCWWPEPHWSFGPWGSSWSSHSRPGPQTHRGRFRRRSKRRWPTSASCSCATRIRARGPGPCSWAPGPTWSTARSHRWPPPGSPWWRRTPSASGRGI